MKMIKKAFSALLILAAIVSVATLQSCKLGCVHGSGNQVSEVRKVTNFSKLDISGDFKIVLKQDSSLSMNITADDNLLKYIKTHVDGDKLYIKTKKTFCTNGQMVITIGVKNLNEIKGAGALEFTSDGKLNTGDLNIDLAGATKVTFDLNANNITTSSSGVTEMNLTGQASSNHVDMSGVAKIHAFGFVVSDYTLETSGASHCEVNALKTLNIQSSGASEVKYKGNPSITNDKSGSSSVEKAE